MGKGGGSLSFRKCGKTTSVTTRPRPPDWFHQPGRHRTRCLFSLGRMPRLHRSVSKNATERQVGLGSCVPPPRYGRKRSASGSMRVRFRKAQWSVLDHFKHSNGRIRENFVSILPLHLLSFLTTCPIAASVPYCAPGACLRIAFATLPTKGP